MNNSVVRYTDYATGFRIATAILCILGAGSNLTVVLGAALANNDSRAFVLLMQIHATTCAIHSLAGFISANRHMSVAKALVFITYGPCSFIGSRFCSIVDVIPTICNSLIPMLIATMMVFRALIMYNFRLTKKLVIVITVILILIDAPVMAYVSIESTGTIQYLWNLSDPQQSELVNEIKVIGAYSIDPNQIPLFSVLFNYVPPISLTICLISRIFMQIRMNNYHLDVNSNTRKVYQGFMHLLTLDATVQLIYVLASQLSVIQKISSGFPEIATFLSFYNHCIFALPAVIQGMSSLYFIPYLRKGLKKIYKKKSETIAFVTSSY